VSEKFELSTTDGETLEARWDHAPNPIGVTVFCHPHPLDRGSMNAPLMIGVSLRLVERGFSVLRFNFRGTGSSTGTHDKGRSEIRDVAAAVANARQTELPLSVAGWSFGAAVALCWLATELDPPPYVGIAPPPEGLPEELPSGPKRIVVGTREQVIDTRALLAYAARLSIDVVLTPGDHFFHGRGRKIGDLVAQGLTG
jgi:alpha/beta superfamily hydrolase